ncbi:type II secretion system F family protein [Akkermansiaceae bacterium]|nr:type II secretion system F family protein [Akkermansiaceae bacterium]
MRTYKYSALDAQGKQTSGTIQGDSEAEAGQKLRDMNLYPTSIADSGEEAGSGAASLGAPEKKKKKGKEISFGSSTVKKIKPAQRMMFTRQLATLIGAGLPLLRSLTVLAKQEPNPKVKQMLTMTADAIQGGATFSQGLTQFPAIFDKLYINMVKAGEVGGVLEVVLDRLAEYMEKAEKLKKKIVGAMIYPIIVLFLAVVIMAFLMLQVVPKFKQMFEENNVELPFISRVVFNFSDNMMADNLLIFDPETVSIFIPNMLILLGAGVLLFLGYKAWRRTESGKDTTDRIYMKLPLLGNLIEKTAVARFTRTLGTLVSSGVPILQALTISKETSGNVVYGKAIGKIHDAVKEGEPLVSPMQSTGVFPALVVSMVDVGEETGQLPDMLTKIADIYEEEVDGAVTALTAVMEPSMIVGLALLVGMIVLAIFMPLLAMIEAVGK